MQLEGLIFKREMRNRKRKGTNLKIFSLTGISGLYEEGEVEEKEEGGGGGCYTEQHFINFLQLNKKRS